MSAEREGGTAAGRLAAAVATAARAHRGLRRARVQLRVDLAAVLGGLRPAVMLDYAVAPAGAVAALVCELAEPGGAAWVCVACAATPPDCCYASKLFGERMLSVTRMPGCAFICVIPSTATQ